MQKRLAAAMANVFLGVVVAAAVVVGVLAILPFELFGPGNKPIREEGLLDKLQEIDPAWIQYVQTDEIKVPLAEPKAIATGPADRIYVAGRQAVAVFSPEGTLYQKMLLTGTPKSLAVGGPQHVTPGNLYLAMQDHVEVLDADGAVRAKWKPPAAKSQLTSIAVAEEDVFVADAGQRIVWRYDPSGNLQQRIGDPAPGRSIPGFVITATSPYFDLAVSHDGLLRVVNPRALRIEAYTFDDRLESFWGKSSPTIEGFFGCCNPSHFAILSDDHFVTVEKGIPRVKLYDSRGNFECVVAGPKQLSIGAADAPPDVACDGRDRILIMDHKAGCVRIFERKTAAGERDE